MFRKCNVYSGLPIGAQRCELAWPEDALSTVRATAAGGEFAWLDSGVSAGASEVDAAHFSMVCAQPVGVLEQRLGRPATWSVGGRVLAQHESGWALWRQLHEQLPLVAFSEAGLSPGWVGYLGFESACQLERIGPNRAEDSGLPCMRLALFDRAVLLDHLARQAWAVAVEGPFAEKLGAAATDARELARWRSDWDAAARRSEEPAMKPPLGATCSFEMSRADYEMRVRRALEYIAAGDIYQVNLAQRLRFQGLAGCFDCYDALRRASPAAYGALLRWAGGAVLSTSPELFLELVADRVRTRPIKGTRRRTGDPRLDAQSRAELLSSAKDAAELAMIIDLHRNDLGRVCAYGSVRVLDPRALETHATVFHTVGEIEGRLRADRSAIDLLAACFPAGSISGVPKIRALQIIHELEPVARGAYTGAIGLLGLDGRMTFNVAIRILQMCGDQGFVHAGGGIVADSNPAAEYFETLDKTRAIHAALTGGRDLTGPYS